MEGWQCIVQVHDIVGTKPQDLASIVQQMRENKQGRLRKFYNDTLMSKRDVKRKKVIILYCFTTAFLFALPTYLGSIYIFLFAERHTLRTMTMLQPR